MGLAFSASGATHTVAQRDPNADDTGPGTAERPWKSIGRAAQELQPGDRVVIRDGIYRERVVIKQSGTANQPIAFQAAPGAHVVMTGADQLSGWQRVAGDWPIYRVAWPHKFIGWNRRMSHPDDDYHQLIGRCEQVAVENYLLRQVLEAGQMAPGTFFADTSNQVLLVWDRAGRDLNKVFVEASVRQEILRLEGAFVQVRGIQFRFAANMAQHGAVVLAGAHDGLEDSVLEDMNASGATLSAEDLVVRRCDFRDNGQIGFGANGAHRLLLTDCRVENNNTKGFDRGWEAGGLKVVLTRDAVLERSQFARNCGSGIWFDIGNEHPTVRQCYIADNEDSGIFYEISFGLQARDNVIVGNGFAATPGAWGAQAGIVLSSSPECVVERNLVVGNREGFNFREQTRTTPRIGSKQEVPVWNHDEIVRHNLIVFNRDAQIWGWFDMKDDRHWPAAARVADASSASKTGVATKGLTLEALNLRFQDNVYFAGPGQGWFGWGPTWARHKIYSDLASFQHDLGIDTGSRAADPDFADLLARDFRVGGRMVEELRACYPRAGVPGAILSKEVISSQ